MLARVPLPTFRLKILSSLAFGASAWLALARPSVAEEQNGSARSEPTSHAAVAAAPSPESAPKQSDGEAKKPIGRSTRQLIVVRSANWPSTTATLTRVERELDGAWKHVGEPVVVNLGRHGMAWGRGLHATPSVGPLKREGDGRSPAGVFSLGSAFGAAPEAPEGAKPFPYLQIRKGVACVEETRSKFYNRIVDASGEKSWERRSEMLRPDGLFRWGVVVEQNAPDTIAGAGSCVFLHIWRGPKEPTSGCTSLPPERLEDLLRWLQADKHPLLAQLPEPVYTSLREGWSLPE